MHLILIISMNIFLTTLVNGQLQDRPPVIDKVVSDMRGGEKELKLPKDYTVVAFNSDLTNIKNKLTCTASNVEELKWQYADYVAGKIAPLESSWKNELPGIMFTRLKPSVSDWKRELELNDGAASLPNDVVQINGYYRCFASNHDGKYVATSPTVRVISPYFDGSLISPLEPTKTATENKPFSLPCMRLPERGSDGTILSGYELIPADAAKYASDSIKFTWEDENKALISDDNGRIKQDPLTGDLYYAYLKSTDAVSSGSGGRLKCVVIIGQFSQDITTNDITDMNIEAASSTIPDEVTIEYPTSDQLEPDDDEPDVLITKRPITCVSNQICTVVCIFGGIKGETGKVRGSSDYNLPTTETKTGFQFVPPEEVVTQKWNCELINPEDTDEVYKTVKIEIKILNYPKFPKVRPPNFLETRYAVAEEKVVFVCDALFVTSGGTTFYMNNEKITEDSPGIEYKKWKDTMFTISQPTPSNSGTAVCISNNSVGELHTTSTLIVYNASKLTEYPVSGYIVTDNNNASGVDFVYSCSAKLDSKVDSAEIMWFSNISGEENRNTVIKEGKFSVDNIYSPPYVAYSGKLESNLSIAYDLETADQLANTLWWCKLTFTVLGKDMDPIVGKELSFEIVDPPQPIVVFGPWPHLPVVLGAVGGFLFLILLIVLINCYVQKNKGEQYYVDEKERKAGHNPEEEMEAYGFSDYTRPDQNPVKGSRASMNFSDKPMESDTGSLDEYGDVDPNRFNEDGSFIGQYGQNQNQHPPRNQADV